ncbi:hypothetical protein EV401DRAFT_1287981 [Pisolithus croceorrhizus]|nr:hypothetical protein EV401DRAFT_1287981 [Pisolithus croceorrhizus]
MGEAVRWGSRSLLFLPSVKFPLVFLPMSRQLSTVTPKLFRDHSSKVVFETSSDDSLDARHLHSFLSTVMSEELLWYTSPMVICPSALTVASEVELSKEGASSKNKFSAMKITRNIPSVLPNSRRSLRAFMDGMGGALTLHQSNVEALFFTNELGPVSDSDLVQQAWAACHVAILPHMAMRLHLLGGIRTNTIPDGVCNMAVLAKISRDGELLDSLKPLTVKNDVMPEITVQMDNLTLTCNRYPTRIRTSTQQFLQIETRSGVQVPGRAIHVKGRKAQVEVLGSLHDDEIKSVTTIGKADLTSAETSRENVIFAILKGESTLLSHPFVKTIWFPGHPIWWLPSGYPKLKIPICCANLEVDPSQERAIEKILSVSDADRLAVIQGPPGTGKTTVIAVAVTSMISCPEASSRTVWIAAQSNVAVKNIAEKFAKLDFYDFALLVSEEFHFDWHEHLYEKLKPCLIRSHTFSRDVVGASRQLRGARVILCTLGMLSNYLVAPFVCVNPVDILIFDEGSQIEVGNYLPVFHRFKHTLTKIVFIGDDKQLPPYGQEDISALQSIFEVQHLRKDALFLDTQCESTPPSSHMSTDLPRPHAERHR